MQGGPRWRQSDGHGTTVIDGSTGTSWTPDAA